MMCWWFVSEILVGNSGLWGKLGQAEDVLEKEHTRRASVRGPSTSKRQIVFLIGRAFRGGMTAGTIVAILD